MRVRVRWCGAGFLLGSRPVSQLAKKSSRTVFSEYAAHAATGVEDLPDLNTLLRLHDERTPTVPGGVAGCPPP